MPIAHHYDQSQQRNREKRKKKNEFQSKLRKLHKEQEEKVYINNIFLTVISF